MPNDNRQRSSLSNSCCVTCSSSNTRARWSATCSILTSRWVQVVITSCMLLQCAIVHMRMVECANVLSVERQAAVCHTGGTVGRVGCVCDGGVWIVIRPSAIVERRDRWWHCQRWWGRGTADVASSVRPTHLFHSLSVRQLPACCSCHQWQGKHEIVENWFYEQESWRS